MSTDNETLIKALRILARDIVSDDGVANACVAEAAARIGELVKENAELSRLRAAVGHMQQELNTLRSREMDADDIADYSEDRAKLKAENDRLKAIDRDREIEIGNLNGKLKRYEFDIQQLNVNYEQLRRIVQQSLRLKEKYRTENEKLKLAKAELVDVLRLVDDLVSVSVDLSLDGLSFSERKALRSKEAEIQSKINAALATHGATK